MPICNVISVTRWNTSSSFRFLIVGGWNFLFGYGVFAALYRIFDGRWSDWSITATATIIGITMSFVTHRFITYRSTGCWWKEYCRFYGVYGVQSLLNIALIWLLVTCLKQNAYIIQFFITVALTITTYWAHKIFSFKKGRTA